MLGALLAAALAMNGSASANAGTTQLVIAPAAVARFVDNFNPFDTAQAFSWTGVDSLFYEPLVLYDGAQADEYYPWLATSWAYSPSGQTVTFELRSGVHFADGSVLTAADAAYSFNLVKQVPALAPGLEVVSASAVGPLSLSLTLGGPAYTEMQALATVPIVKAGYGGADPLRYVDRSPDGTGPYALARGGFSPQRLVLAARHGYWQRGEPAVQRLVFPAFRDPAQLRAALTSGGLDWAGTFMPDVRQAYAAREPAHHHYWLVPVATVALDLNLASGATSELAVRNAISDDLDRQAISTAVSGGYDPPATSAPGLVMPADAGLVGPGAGTRLSTHAQRAAAGQAMTAGGFHIGAAGYWVGTNGRPLALRLVAPSGTVQASVGEVVARELSAAGFAVSYRALGPAAWQEALSSGAFDAAVVRGQNGPDPYPMYRQWLDPALLVGGRAAQGDYGRLSRATLPAAATVVSRGLAAYASSPPGSPAAVAAARSIASVVDRDRLVVPVVYASAWGEFSTAHAIGWPSGADPYEPATPEPPFLEYTLLQLSPAN